MERSRVADAFQIETCLQLATRLEQESLDKPRKYVHLSVLRAATNGSHVAIAFSMRNKATIHGQTGITSFWQGVLD
jgi:hypothetical protein